MLVSGLDDVIASYIPHFQKQGLNGKQLLCLSHSDLEKCQVKKLGHQELILEAVDQLTQLVTFILSFLFLNYVRICVVLI